MRSFCSLEEEEEEDRFFDTREDITSVSDSSSDCPDNVELGSSLRIVDLVSSSVRYDLWMKNPDSVNERRSNFFKWLGMSSDEAMKGDSGEQSGIEFSVEIGRTREDSGAVLANSDCEVTFSSSRPSMSCYSSDTLDSSERGGSEANFVCRIKNLDDGTEFVVDRLGHDGMLSRLREVGSNRLLSVEEFQNTLGLSPLVKQFMCREADAGKTNSMETTKRAKRGWLKRLGAAACIVDMEDGGGSLRLTPSGVGTVAKVQRVRVHSSKKRSKELSALYTGQEIQAHKGTIRTMRFSPDGCYLATAGEDRSVRVWQVMESERSNDIDIPDIDPSRLYFRANQYSELAPISSEKEKSYKVKNLRRTSDSSCVIFPPRVFRLSEKPLHEFYGHSGEILDLSWSNHMHLLSSSVDKTVRLWRVGCDQCLRVFSHNNYVTCIQFNPVDDNYFISGSIDGKVRIWDVPGCRVVDWTDVKEIVTALCYRPDGKGAIVGSMGGNCRFYNVTDNHLLLDGQICIQGKKKSPGKRITGFQFSPSDPSKLMVTSADSQVRILSGVDVICKYKGLRNAGSQISASFTVDGKHIVSASEDSNVYVWNYSCQDGPAPSKEKSIHSYERFFSDNVSVAVPWCGMRNKNSVGLRLGTHLSHQISVASPTDPINGWHHYHLSENSHNTIPLSPPDCLSLHQGFFSEALPKGSATWPEEKLPSNSPSVSSVMCKTQYKFLKSFYQSTSPSHAWGHVIVTGGWDGRIRSFHNYGLPVHT